MNAQQLEILEHVKEIIRTCVQAATMAERARCAGIAQAWGVSTLSNGDLTDAQLNGLLNGIGPNIAEAIRLAPTDEG